MQGSSGCLLSCRRKNKQYMAGNRTLGRETTSAAVAVTCYWFPELPQTESMDFLKRCSTLPLRISGAGGGGRKEGEEWLEPLALGSQSGFRCLSGEPMFLSLLSPPDQDMGTAPELLLPFSNCGLWEQAAMGCHIQLGTGLVECKFLFLVPAPFSTFPRKHTHCMPCCLGARTGRRNFCIATVPSWAWHPASLLSAACSLCGTGVALQLIWW